MYDRERTVFCCRAATADYWALYTVPQGTKRRGNSHSGDIFQFLYLPFEEIILAQGANDMRHAVAPTENVENNSYAVTSLLKICTHCERLSKKVRYTKGTALMLQSAANINNNDALGRLFVSSGRATEAQPFSFCPDLFTREKSWWSGAERSSVFCLNARYSKWEEVDPQTPHCEVCFQPSVISG